MERGQFQFRTQVIGLSLNALDKNINANLQNTFNLPAPLTREGLKREWNEVRRTPKPIQEIDTLIVGDSMIKDIKPSLMSASNTIRKQCLRGAKVEECTLKSILVVTNVAKL